MRRIIVDVEATCWENSSWQRRQQMEIIEIGAVRLGQDLDVIDEFGSFVQPVAHRQLSPFCKELTSITQADVDSADLFPVVFHRFLDWIGDDAHALCSWGAYDLGQFELDAKRSGMQLPGWFAEQHVNLKAEFASWSDVRRCGMAKALDHLGLPLDGVHHRGIDDARNIARIAQRMFRQDA